MRNTRVLAASLAALSVIATTTLATTAFAVESDFSIASTPNNVGALTLVYDPATGYVSANSGASDPFTTLQLISKSGLFIADAIEEGVLTPPWDVISEQKLFKLDTDGIDDIGFGLILPPGKTAQELADEFAVDGSFKGGGDLLSRGQAPMLFVPEPSSIALLTLGFLGLLRMRRRG